MSSSFIHTIEVCSLVQWTKSTALLKTAIGSEFQSHLSNRVFAEKCHKNCQSLQFVAQPIQGAEKFSHLPAEPFSKNKVKAEFSFGKQTYRVSQRTVCAPMF